MKTEKVIAAGVLPVCPSTGRILLVQRGMGQSHSGTWACFGGGFEPSIDLNPKDNAKREFVEESRFAGKYSISNRPLYVNENNMMDFYTYLGIFQTEFTPDIEKEKEAMDFGWFYLDELPENLLPGFAETIKNKYQTIQKIICFYSDNC